jgi:membrane protein DedA with SNARE-associated domain/membrane-associated phospholipid phosphatase
MEIVEFLIEMIEQYGYIIVFLAIMLESMGVPLPGETTLVIAAAAAGTGHLNIFGVIIAAASGAIIGDGIGYWLGRRLGRPFLEKHGRWFHLTEDRMFKLEKLFVKHGPMTVFFGRFFSLLRTYAALFAGVWRMKYTVFTLYNALGGIVWATVFGVLGFVFGQNLPALEKIAKTIGWALTIPLVCFVAIALAWRWSIKHKELLNKRFGFILEKSGYNYLVKRFSWQIHWLLRHWTAAQYTIIHITTGLILACFGVYIFVKVSISAFTDRKIAEWDQYVFTILQSWATPVSTTFFEIITTIGSYGIFVAAISTIILFIIKRKWVNAITMATVVAGGQVIVFVLKLIYARPAPPTVDQNAIFIWLGFSFPSGHVMGSLIILGMLSYFLIIWSKKWVFGTGISFFSAIFVLFIAFSRIYLGENYLSDVLCGLAGGFVWLSGCITALELLRRGQVGDRRRKKRVIVKVEIATPQK